MTMKRAASTRHQEGMTLTELIVTVAILSILAMAALPVARFQVRREKERMLRHDLEQMRDAIDRYKSAADHGAFLLKVDTLGYPPTLETLVEGIEVQGRKVTFLRSIPVDPMTGKAEWRLRSVQDDPASGTWGGENVFDVNSTSQAIGMNGRKYSEW